MQRPLCNYFEFPKTPIVAVALIRNAVKIKISFNTHAQNDIVVLFKKFFYFVCKGHLLKFTNSFLFHEILTILRSSEKRPISLCLILYEDNLHKRANLETYFSSF